MDNHLNCDPCTFSGQAVAGGLQCDYGLVIRCKQSFAVVPLSPALLTERQAQGELRPLSAAFRAYASVMGVSNRFDNRQT